MKTSQRQLKMAKQSKAETTGNANLLATTVSDIGLQPNINYAKLKRILCGQIKG